MQRLFEKSHIGNIKLKNRIVMAPLETTDDADCGSSLIITGAHVVSTKYEDHPYTTLNSFRHVDRLALLIENCHRYGAKACVQISPELGRTAFTKNFTPSYSASECESFWFPELKCQSLDKEAIHYLTEQLAYGASLAKAAGADAVELHAYGGYLLDQFHSKHWNTHTDEYGGDLRGRMRFTLEAIAATRTTCGRDFPLLVKFTAYHGITDGGEFDERIEMVKLLQETGIDALHVDINCNDTWFQTFPSVYHEEAHQINVIAAIKNIAHIPILGQSNLFNPILAEQLIEDKMIDYVVLEHQMLTTPAWVKKIKVGQLQGNPSCSDTNLCLAKANYQLPAKSDLQKSILVIGGNPSGMEAAIMAALRGFKVELWEKEKHLGGSLWGTGLPSFNADVRKLISYMARQSYRLGVDIKLGKMGTPEEIKKGHYDKVILATRSKILMPPIIGIEHSVTATDVLLENIPLGDNIVVIGSGLVGYEIAAYLKESASKAMIIEIPDDILLATSRNNNQALQNILKKHDIPIKTRAKVTEIGKDFVTYQNTDGEARIACDMVIIAAGYHFCNSLEEALEDDLTVIGDAVAPKKILTAIHETYQAIRIIE